MYRVTISKSADLPVSVQEITDWARLDDLGLDDEIESLVRAGTAVVENITGRTLPESTVEFHFGPSDRCSLPTAPVRHITKIERVDWRGDRTLVPSSEYLVQLTDNRMAVHFHSYVSCHGLIVTAEVGYVDPVDIPQPLKQAITVWVSDSYANREGQGKGIAAIERLCAPYRVSLL